MKFLFIKFLDFEINLGFPAYMKSYFPGFTDINTKVEN